MIFKGHPYSGAMAAVGAVACLLAASCSPKAGDREYYYRNYGQSWTEYVPPFDSLEQFHLSPDGNHVCYLLKRDGKWYVGINGSHTENFQGSYSGDQGTGTTVVLSPDGLHVGVVYQRQAAWRPVGEPGRRQDAAPRPQWFVEIDRRVLGGFDGDFAPELQFSRGGEAFGLAFKRDGQYYVQIVDTTFGPYRRADFAITPDGEVVIAYLEGSYIHLERLGRVGAAQ